MYPISLNNTLFNFPSVEIQVNGITAESLLWFPIHIPSTLFVKVTHAAAWAAMHSLLLTGHAVVPLMNVWVVLTFGSYQQYETR